MLAVSANEVDRMLFSIGLSSPIMHKKEHNEMMRRAWANRRVTERATTLHDHESFVICDPPVSTLIKDNPKDKDQK